MVPSIWGQVSEISQKNEIWSQIAFTDLDITQVPRPEDPYNPPRLLNAVW